jgi:hypothetical protein
MDNVKIFSDRCVVAFQDARSVVQHNVNQGTIDDHPGGAVVDVA